MFKNKFFVIIFIFGIFGIIFYSLSSSESYLETVIKQRATFEQNLMQEKDSPIKNLNDFSGIKYFEADKNFIVDADFKAITSSEKGMILMTDSTQSEMKKAGTRPCLSRIGYTSIWRNLWRSVPACLFYLRGLRRMAWRER